MCLANLDKVSEAQEPKHEGHTWQGMAEAELPTAVSRSLSADHLYDNLMQMHPFREAAPGLLVKQTPSFELWGTLTSGNGQCEKVHLDLAFVDNFPDVSMKSQ